MIIKTTLFIKKYNKFFRRMRREAVSGFTLIELLVVIAVIGILSSVVLASLNSARGKGANAVIKSDMTNMVSQAALYYDDHQSYAGICTDPKFYSIFANATSTGGGTSDCADDQDSWSSYAQLKVPETSGSYWCADNKGTPRAISSIPSTWITSSCQQAMEWYAIDDPAGYVNWFDGGAYCASLSTAGGLKSGEAWRLPSKDELVAKWNETQTNPASSFQSDGYWSGTTDPDNINYAYVVGMDSGVAFTGNNLYNTKTNPYLLVRCAR